MSREYYLLLTQAKSLLSFFWCALISLWVCISSLSLAQILLWSLIFVNKYCMNCWISCSWLRLKFNSTFSTSTKALFCNKAYTLCFTVFLTDLSVSSMSITSYLIQHPHCPDPQYYQVVKPFEETSAVGWMWYLQNGTTRLAMAHCQLQVY